MSKERLEEIINDLPYSIRHEGSTEVLIEYAKEQAERVEGLREANADLVELGEYILKHFRSYIDGTTTETAQKIMDRMYKQNKCYRDLLGKIENNMGITDEENNSLLEEINKVLEGDPHG